MNIQKQYMQHRKSQESRLVSKVFDFSKRYQYLCKISFTIAFIILFLYSILHKTTSMSITTSSKKLIKPYFSLIAVLATTIHTS